MYDSKSIIAIIPARGGSKGLEGKNIRPLCGKPLIAWTIERALESRHLDTVMVTTDAPEIAEVARHHGAEVPFLRPAHLATDAAPSIDAMVHALDHYEAEHGRRFDYVLLLEPTSPLRAEGDIDAMIEALIDAEGEFDTVISLGEFACHPALAKKLIGAEVTGYFGEAHVTGRRQTLEAAYFPYGVGYLCRVAALREARSIYAGRIMAYPIQRYQCLEIDDIYDFLAVEAVMRHQLGGL